MQFEYCENCEWLRSEYCDSNWVYSKYFGHLKNTKYWNVTVYSTNANTGCVASDDLVITVLPNEDVFIPNAFSPNNDLVNNTIFPILGNGVQLASFKIYNRWGLKVYDGIDKFGWDGYYNNDLQEIGVYSYYCEYFIIDGTRKRKQGTILLMK